MMCGLREHRALTKLISVLLFEQKVTLAADASEYVCIEHLDRGKDSSVQTDLNTILLLELTALFDSHGVRTEQLIRVSKKVKRKLKTSFAGKDNLFGRTLQELVERDGRKFNWQLPIPLMLQQLIEYVRNNGLEEEGILRIGASVQRTQSLCDELNKLYSSTSGRSCGCTLDQMLNQLLSEYSISDCIAVFKQFIRRLPEPLLTFRLLDAFLAVARLPDLDQQLQTLNILVLLLPPINRHTLRRILRLLGDIRIRSECNKMTLTNVSTVIAPNLFPNILLIGIKSAAEMSKSSAIQISRALDSCKVTQLLINYQDILFYLPLHLSKQMQNLKTKT